MEGIDELYRNVSPGEYLDGSHHVMETRAKG